jgi:hypothetical protein
LAGAYKLRIKGSCEDPQATKHKLVRALWGAAHTLSSAASSHTNAGSHTDAAEAYENSAALHQEVVEIYSVLEDRENHAVALQYAADALHDAAISHTLAGNHGDAAARHTESAALHMRCADIFENMARQANISRNRARQAENLGTAAIALSSAAASHTLAGNHGDAAARYTASAALSQSSAEMYLVLGDGVNQADALLGASIALRDAARSHTRAANHAAAEEATRESARLLTEREMILGALATPGA